MTEKNTEDYKKQPILETRNQDKRNSRSPRSKPPTVTVQQIYTWGYGQEGTLGLGESSHEHIPRLIGGFEQINFVQVSAGLYHTLAVTDTGQLYSWGRGENGRLGHGDLLTRFRPKLIEHYEAAESNCLSLAEHGIKFKFIAAGFHHNIAISNEGILFTWGSGWSGQLGHNDTLDRRRPRPVVLYGNASPPTAAVSTEQINSPTQSQSHLTTEKISSSSLTSPSASNILDNTSILSATTGTTPPNLVIFKAAAGGYHHTLALTQDGKIYSFGAGEMGQLGNENLKSALKPTPIPDLNEIAFKQIEAAEYHSAALTVDGDVYTWGNGIYGELAQGEQVTNCRKPKKTQVNDNEIVKFVNVGVGAYHTVAISEHGQIYYAGRMLHGGKKLRNFWTLSKLPVASNDISKNIKFTQVAARNTHILAISSEPKIYSWGQNNYGQLGNASDGAELLPVEGLSSSMQPVAVAVGANHSVALIRLLRTPSEKTSPREHPVVTLRADSDIDVNGNKYGTPEPRNTTVDKTEGFVTENDERRHSIAGATKLSTSAPSKTISLPDFTKVKSPRSSSSRTPRKEETNGESKMLNVRATSTKNVTNNENLMTRQYEKDTKESDEKEKSSQEDIQSEGAVRRSEHYKKKRQLSKSFSEKEFGERHVSIKEQVKDKTKSKESEGTIKQLIRRFSQFIKEKTDGNKPYLPPPTKRESVKEIEKKSHSAPIITKSKERRHSNISEDDPLKQLFHQLKELRLKEEHILKAEARLMSVKEDIMKKEQALLKEKEETRRQIQQCIDILEDAISHATVPETESTSKHYTSKLTMIEETGALAEKQEKSSSSVSMVELHSNPSAQSKEKDLNDEGELRINTDIISLNEKNETSSK